MILKIIWIGLINWMLVLMALESLVERRRVLAVRHGLWALAIVFILLWYTVLFAASSA